MVALRIVRRLKFFRVVLLAFAAFVFNTTEFLSVVLLSDIAHSFQIPVAQTGLMITIYAWIVSLMSLPFMLMTAKLERRSLLIKLFIIFVASHILSVLAWDFWVLLLSRIGIAFTHAIFWSITTSLAVRVAPKDKKAQAIGLLAMGSALAMVLGLPLGRIIGQFLGWREAFGIIAFLAFCILLLLYRFLPHLASHNAGSLPRHRGDLSRHSPRPGPKGHPSRRHGGPAGGSEGNIHRAEGGRRPPEWRGCERRDPHASCGRDRLGLFGSGVRILIFLQI